jgi:hypothetical protein
MASSAATVGSGSGVLHSVALTGYRELLGSYGLKLVGGQQAGSSMDEGAMWVKDAKNRVKAKLKRKVVEKYQRLVAYDPIRAFRRLQGRMQEVSAVYLTRSHCAALTPPLEAHLQCMDSQQLQDVKGPDGLLRVRPYPPASPATPPRDDAFALNTAHSLLPSDDMCVLPCTLSFHPLYPSHSIMQQDLLVPLVSAASRFFMHRLTNFTVNGSEKFAAALDRPPGTPLITVSNHVGALDDPFVIAAILPPERVSDSKAMRWTMCASDRCFKHTLLSPLFRAAKVLETERGLGLRQPAMWAAEERLSAGDWVHIFPEGTRSKNGGKVIGKVR